MKTLKVIPQKLVTKAIAKGFNEYCDYSYTKDGEIIPVVDDRNYPTFKTPDEIRRDSDNYCIAAPSHCGILYWFREKFNTHIHIGSIDIFDTLEKREYYYTINLIGNKIVSLPIKYLDYNDALNVAIEVVLNSLPDIEHTEPQPTPFTPIESIVIIGKQLLSEFDEDEVYMKTPIAYHKKFEALRKAIESYENKTN